MSKIKITAVAFMVVLGVLAGTASAADDVIRLRCGAAGTTTWSYGCSTAISEIVRQADPTLDITVQATAGSTGHYKMFKRGEIDLGTGTTYTDAWAMAGRAPLYKEKFNGEFNTLVMISKAYLEVVVLDDSSIRTMQDLNGKKVFVGDAGSASTQMNVEILDILEINCKRVAVARSEGFEMLKDGRVDVLMQTQGIPYAMILDLASTRKIRHIPFSDEDMSKLKTRPYNATAVITPKDYSFEAKDVQTGSNFQDLNISPKVSNEVAYKLTKTIIENWDKLVAVVPATKKVDPLKDILNASAPIHPGALRYYQERGVVFPKHLLP